MNKFGDYLIYGIGRYFIKLDKYKIRNITLKISNINKNEQVTIKQGNDNMMIYNEHGHGQEKLHF